MRRQFFRRTNLQGLHVDTVGKGSRVLLIHGSCCSIPALDDWKEQQSLAEHFQLVMPARRGYYLSSDRSRGYGFEEESDELADLLGAGAHLVGFSYGAVLALLVAAKRRNAVRSLTVIETGAIGLVRGDAEAETMIRRLTKNLESAEQADPDGFYLSLIRALRSKTEKELPELDAQAKAELATPMMRRAVQATMLEKPTWIADIPVEAIAAAPFPKLVVSGGWSPVFEKISDTLGRRMSAQREVITGSGHMVMLTGKPFNDRLSEFLTSKS